MKKGKCIILNTSIVFLVYIPMMFALTSCSEQPTITETSAPTPIPTSVPNPKGKSENWKVEITSSKLESPYSSGSVSLLLKLRIEYIGPAGSFAPPPIVVTDLQGTKLNVDDRVRRLEGRVDNMRNVELSSWLLDGVLKGAKKQLMLQTGEKFEIGIFYHQGYDEKSNRTLLFADVPPLSFMIKR